MLAQKALLNALTGFIDQGARILVGFVVMPLLVTHLGPAIFGVWQVLIKVSTQFAPLDGRAQEVLKWVIARRQHSSDNIGNQRYVAAAAVCLLVFSPLVLSAYLILSYWLPEYLDLPADQIGNARIAVGVLCVNAYVLSLSMIVEATLRGMNLFYKLLGLRAVLIIGGGAITVAAAYLGYGLVGIAAAQLVASLIALPAYLIVARRWVQWLGISKPSRRDLNEVFHRSKWFALSELLGAWLVAGEVVVLGAFVPAEMVSQYVLTIFAVQMITVTVLTGVSSVLPGLGGVVGKGEFKRAEQIRKESLLYSWWLSLAICGTVIALNRSFVTLWVGAEQYTGETVNALIVICVFQVVFIRHDSFMLNLALDIRKKVVLGVISFISTLLLMFVLVPQYDLVGLCVSLVIGRGILSIAYPMIVSRFLGASHSYGLPVKYWFSAAILLLATWKLSIGYITLSWWSLIVDAVLLISILLLFAYIVVMGKEERKMVIYRINSLIQREAAH